MAFSVRAAQLPAFSVEPFHPDLVRNRRRRRRASGGALAQFLCNFADSVNPELFFFRIHSKKGKYLQLYRLSE
jgi:hypothetical protein